MPVHYPAFVSVVAFALGLVDLMRGASHTFFSLHAATNVAGLDLSGPTGLDQLVLMNAFGAANFLTGAALIYFALRDRLGALVFLGIIPFGYMTSAVGLYLNGADLVGQAEFPGQYMLMGYMAVCFITVFAAVGVMRHQMRGRLSL